LSEKEDIFENNLDLLLLFAIYYCEVLNDDKLGRYKRELKINKKTMAIQENGRMGQHFGRCIENYQL